MLTIRKAQFAVFSQAELAKFEEWMLAHLRRFFPARCSALGERGLRETIQLGVRRAAGYEMTIKRDVCKYIDVMLLFGNDFDSDERLPWAGRILKMDIRPEAKARLLVDAAVYHLGRR